MYNSTSKARDHTPATEKARRLLCQILPAGAREQFLMHGFFDWHGKRARYRIHRSAQTEIYINGSLHARACLQLTIPAPSCDRMIAEYLILRNDETLYWSKANIESVRRTPPYASAVVFLFDLALLLKLIVDYLL
jgi:hypothetical protein